MMNLKPRRKKLSDENENTIRYQFYALKIPAKQIMDEWQISQSMLSRVVCGPTTQKCKGIEAIYGGD